MVNASDHETDWGTVVVEDPQKGRKKTSSVWKFCEPIDAAYALCTICQHKLSYKSSVTNLRKHFKKKHPEIIMAPNLQYSRNGNHGADSDDDRGETQRATNSVIVDYLRPAGEENRSSKFHSVRNSTSYSKYSSPVKRERSPDRLDFRNSKYSRHEETEFELFGRGIVMQLKQLPLVHALEVQAEITNLIVQKRIQALRQSHQTSTEDTPMQYALVYATSEHTSQENCEEITGVQVEKVPSEQEENIQNSS